MKTGNTREGRITARRARSLTFSPPSLFVTAAGFAALPSTARFWPAGFAVLMFGLVFFFPAFGIHFNLTDSLPMGLYRAVPDSPTHGSLVSVCLPDDLAALAKDRGYGRPGSCPGGIAPLLKRIVAIPGDTVLITESGLTVNDAPIPNTTRLVRDSEGREIPMIEVGTYQTVQGELWLIANHSTRSWDSRYFGAIPMDRVQSVMRPLLMLDFPIDTRGGQ
jgi:conjugative transfer signal peptidase TraF